MTSRKKNSKVPKKKFRKFVFQNPLLTFLSDFRFRYWSWNFPQFPRQNRFHAAPHVHEFSASNLMDNGQAKWSFFTQVQIDRKQWVFWNFMDKRTWFLWFWGQIPKIEKKLLLFFRKKFGNFSHSVISWFFVFFSFSVNILLVAGDFSKIRWWSTIKSSPNVVHGTEWSLDIQILDITVNISQLANLLTWELSSLRIRLIRGYPCTVGKLGIFAWGKSKIGFFKISIPQHDMTYEELENGSKVPKKIMKRIS